MKSIDRRDFLKKMTASTVGASWLAMGSRAMADVRKSARPPFPKRRLGRTGFDASIVGLGGQSTLEQPGRRAESVAIINRALDLGINYIDTAEAYGGGISETYIGEVMQGRRDEVFLASKTRLRTRNGIEDNRFEKSCERLQTDFIDLYFLHAVDRKQDLDTALDRGNGAILAFERLREKNRIGNIGISSHSCALLEEAMERYDFDCIFLTVNPAGLSMRQSPEQTRRFLKKARRKNVGIIAMKVTGRNSIFRTGITMEQALRYSLSAGRTGQSFPVATAVIGITSIGQVDENVRLAKKYEAYTNPEMDRLEKLVNG